MMSTHVNDADTSSHSPPSLLQRIASFIDSPCGLGIGQPNHEHEAISTPNRDGVEPTKPCSDARSVNNEPPPVVTPTHITQPPTKRHRRRLQNRSTASRKIRQERLAALFNNQRWSHPHPEHITNPSPHKLRRVKSLQFSPSPTSVTAATSSVFWSESTDQFEAVYCRPIEECCLAANSNSPDRPFQLPQDNWNLNLFEQPEWCCNDISNAANTSFEVNQSIAYSLSEGCDGYIDYMGRHHPHTSHNCQGCKFRLSLFDGGGVKKEEEVYYDSDYGELYPRFGRDLEEPQRTPIARRRSRAGHPTSGVSDDQPLLNVTMDSSPDSLRTPDSLNISADTSLDILDVTDESSPDRQTYMYDYFTQQQIVTPLRTGICATDEADVGECVQEALNSTWILTWHPNISTDFPSLSPQPKLCNVWIERGYRRNVSQAVEPRLMWREAKVNKSNYSELMERPNSLSLLAIRRVVHGENGPKIHPFAKSNCMIIVKSSLGKDYCFEASSVEERDRIIHLWKICTARLVSYAATQNTEQMLDEFFNEYSVH